MKKLLFTLVIVATALCSNAQWESTDIVNSNGAIMYHNYESASPEAYMIGYDGGNTRYPRIRFGRAAGTLSSPGDVASEERTFQILSMGYHTSSWKNATGIEGTIDGTVSNTSMPGRLEFLTTPTATVTPLTRMTIKESGNVGIGTETPMAKLSVDGSAIFNESGAGMNFRIESDGNENMLFVHGGTNKVGIGTATPGSELDVNGTLRLSGTTSGYVGLKGAAAAGSTTYTLPSADGTNGYVLSTNGSGTLSWVVDGTGSGDDLGDHICDQNLRLGSYWLSGDGGDEGLKVGTYGDVGIGLTPDASFDLKVNDDVAFLSQAIVGGITNATGAQLTVHGNAHPGSDGIYDLGSASLEWYDIFLSNQPTVGSDRRLKDNIENLSYGLEELLNLRSITYTLKSNPNGGTHLGFIAQEVKEVVPEIVSVSEGEKKMMGVKYSALIPVLVNAIQQQQAIIESEREARKEAVKELQVEMVSIKALLSGSTGNLIGAGQDISAFELTLSDAQRIVLSQNDPNPFREKTTISYYLPEDVASSKIVVIDIQGRLIKEAPITAGQGVIEVFASDLSSGTYTYSIIADGKVIDSKKMVVSK